MKVILQGKDFTLFKHTNVWWYIQHRCRRYTCPRGQQMSVPHCSSCPAQYRPVDTPHSSTQGAWQGCYTPGWDSPLSYMSHCHSEKNEVSVLEDFIYTIPCFISVYNMYIIRTWKCSSTQTHLQKTTYFFTKSITPTIHLQIRQGSPPAGTNFWPLANRLRIKRHPSQVGQQSPGRLSGCVQGRGEHRSGFLLHCTRPFWNNITCKANNDISWCAIILNSQWNQQD